MTTCVVFIVYYVTMCILHRSARLHGVFIPISSILVPVRLLALHRSVKIISFKMSSHSICGGSTLRNTT